MATSVDSKDIQEHLDKVVCLLWFRDFVEEAQPQAIVQPVVETRMVVQVPVRHEKLIVEQVSPERKQLAEIDLGQENFLGLSCPKTLGKSWKFTG